MNSKVSILSIIDRIKSTIINYLYNLGQGRSDVGHNLPFWAIVDESAVKCSLSSDPSRILEVELADGSSSAPSESSQVEQTDDSSPKKGFWRRLWEKIESNLIWDLIKCMLGAMAVWIGLVFPQLKTATLEKAAVFFTDYMADVLADLHVVLSSLI